MVDAFKYQGQELQLFEKAANWKSYFSSIVSPHIKGRVLECGAGIGSTSKLLNDGSCKEWILLEPDNEMAEQLRRMIGNNELPANSIVRQGTIAELDTTNKFDTIIYIDVLEHIEHDKNEIEKTTRMLTQYGKLIVLSPAFPTIYSEFDKAIGHYRRYTKNELNTLVPASLKKIYLSYLDSMGFFLSFANKLMLRQSYPTAKQINIWDKYFIPISKITDKLFNYSFGKSILGIWQKTNTND